MKLSNTVIALVVVGAFAGGILGAQAAGVWQTESSKVPATYTEGEFAGEYDPADIRGSYSFEDIEDAFAVPVAALAQAYGVAGEENPGAFLVKSLEGLYEGAHEELEIGTDSVRLFVARYIDRPITVGDSTGIPEGAIPILEERGAVDSDLLARVVPLPEAEAITAPVPTDKKVRGMTTFAELQSWGVAEAEITPLFAGSIGAGNVVLRDYAAEQGVEFSTIKDQIQALVDARE